MLAIAVIPLLVGQLLLAAVVRGSDILMITMGGTKSHKIPFWELARGLIQRQHNVTFLNGFLADFQLDGLHEITPSGLVNYIQNYTQDWDLVGARMRGDLPISLWDAIRYPLESCDALLNDHETQRLLDRQFHLLILDGAYPECALALVHRFRVPFMYINTVGFYTGSLSLAGNPSAYSVSPAFYSSYTDDMSLAQRMLNTVFHVFANIVHAGMISTLQTVVRRHLGEQIPSVYDISRNVSFILQNGHSTVSYPRPLLPNVAEIACIHCKPARPLPKHLDDFVMASGEAGFVYVSMGSSVKAANMPEHLRRLLVQSFARLPFRVLWKWEGGNQSQMYDLPSNVRLSRWLPQQDVLGHRKLRAFVTHGGLLSMFESVYHGVPVVTMPVFCDHDVNAAKAEADGYAVLLRLEQLSAERLTRAILRVVQEPRFRQAARLRQRLLLDQRSTPLETAIYWTEYVIRHNGAYHLQSPARHMSFVKYYLIDVIALFALLAALAWTLIKRYTTCQAESGSPVDRSPSSGSTSLIPVAQLKDKIH